MPMRTIADCYVDEKKADGKDEEKIVGGPSLLYAISPILKRHVALDDSDIQILKTYVRHHKRLVVKAYSVTGSRSLRCSTQETRN
jgi:hypothetical protein